MLYFKKAKSESACALVCMCGLLTGSEMFRGNLERIYRVANKYDSLRLAGAGADLAEVRTYTWLVCRYAPPLIRP